MLLIHSFYSFHVLKKKKKPELSLLKTLQKILFLDSWCSTFITHKQDTENGWNMVYY